MEFSIYCKCGAIYRQQLRGFADPTISAAQAHWQAEHSGKGHGWASRRQIKKMQHGPAAPSREGE